MTNLLLYIFAIFRRILVIPFRLFTRKRYIIFENWGGYGDSPRKVYDELIRRGYGEKYGMIWASNMDVNSIEAPQEIAKNCIIIDYTKLLSFKNHILMSLCQASIVCDNYVICAPKRKGKATAFYICHGSPVKDTRSYYPIPDCFVDQYVCASPQLIPALSYATQFPQDRIQGLGYPRNDDLFRNDLDLNELFGYSKQKFIAWYPTFRKNKFFKTIKGGVNQIPLIHEQSIAIELNEYAKKNDIVFVLKPHHSQDLSIFKNLDFSNIRLIDDAFFAEHGITSYHFLANCDALVTDYSSVIYDYMLCNKPIALIWEDIEEYRKSPGLAPNIEQYLECAHKVYSLQDMKKFLDIVKNGNDPLEEIRQKVKLAVNASDKPDNTARVTDYIIKMAKL